MRSSLLKAFMACLIAFSSGAQTIPNFKKALFVSHLSGTNKVMITRAGAPKHHAIDKVICFKYKCCMVVGWHRTQQRNKFKRYKKDGIPRLQYLKNDSLKRNEDISKPSVRDSIPSVVAAPVKEIKKDSTVAFVFDDVLFDTNSSHLKKEFTEQLDSLSIQLKKYSNYSIKIVGHTDNSGVEMNNLKLSKHRAESVASYLASTGIDPELITTDGKGSTISIDNNNTMEGRKKNRRVEILVSFR